MAWEDLWSPWIDISVSYPCALVLALALPNPLQHRLLTTSTTHVEKTKVYSDAGEKVSSLHWFGSARTQAGPRRKREETYTCHWREQAFLLNNRWRPVYCQKLINGARRGKVTSR